MVLTFGLKQTQHFLTHKDSRSHNHFRLSWLNPPPNLEEPFLDFWTPSRLLRSLEICWAHYSDRLDGILFFVTNGKMSWLFYLLSSSTGTPMGASTWKMNSYHLLKQIIYWGTLYSDLGIPMIKDLFSLFDISDPDTQQTFKFIYSCLTSYYSIRTVQLFDRCFGLLW